MYNYALIIGSILNWLFSHNILVSITRTCGSWIEWTENTIMLQEQAANQIGQGII